MVIRTGTSSERSQALWLRESGRLPGGGGIDHEERRTCLWLGRGPGQGRTGKGREEASTCSDVRASNQLNLGGGWAGTGFHARWRSRLAWVGSPPHRPGPAPTTRLLLQFGRTEVIDNTLNPDFVRKFIVDYFFEEKQNLRFDL